MYKAHPKINRISSFSSIWLSLHYICPVLFEDIYSVLLTLVIQPRSPSIITSVFKAAQRF